MKPDATVTKIPMKDLTNFVIPETLSCHDGPWYAQAPALFGDMVNTRYGNTSNY